MYLRKIQFPIPFATARTLTLYFFQNQLIGGAVNLEMSHSTFTIPILMANRTSPAMS